MNSVHQRKDTVTARLVGILFLVGMFVGIPGSMLIQSIMAAPDYLTTLSANAAMIAFGALLWMICVAGDAAHGILMYPILRRHDEQIAAGYLGFRILDALFIGIHVLFVLLQIPLGAEYLKAGSEDIASLRILSGLFIKANLYAYNLGMVTLGIAGTLMCYSFYRTHILPRFVALWGLGGYVVILIGSVLEVMGIDLMLMHTLPGGLWELFIGFWLIVKGFKPSTIAQTESH